MQNRKPKSGIYRSLPKVAGSGQSTLFAHAKVVESAEDANKLNLTAQKKEEIAKLVRDTFAISFNCYKFIGKDDDGKEMFESFVLESVGDKNAPHIEIKNQDEFKNFISALKMYVLNKNADSLKDDEESTKSFYGKIDHSMKEVFKAYRSTKDEFKDYKSSEVQFAILERINETLEKASKTLTSPAHIMNKKTALDFGWNFGEFSCVKIAKAKEAQAVKAAAARAALAQVINSPTPPLRREEELSSSGVSSSSVAGKENAAAAVKRERSAFDVLMESQSKRIDKQGGTARKQ